MTFSLNKKIHGLFRQWCKNLSKITFKDMGQDSQINQVLSKV
jgi:hypothetical protein